MDKKLIYGLEDKPPLGRAIFLGIQHLLTMFGATIAVPLLIAEEVGMDSPQTIQLLSAVWLTVGISTLLQVNIGTRLPIVQGASFSFIPPLMAIIGATAASGCAVTMQYIGGAVIAGALFELLLGWSGLFGMMKRYIGPVTIGPVITLIGLSLFATGAPKAGEFWPLSLLVIICIFLFSQILSRRILLPKAQIYFRMFPILLAVALGWAVAIIATLTGAVPGGHPIFIDFSYVSEAPLFILPRPFPWGAPRFSLGFGLGILAGYVSSMFESFGHYHAISAMCDLGYPDSGEISRGIGAEGLGCFIGGLFGGLPSTSYGENIGAIGITGVGSRFVVSIAAALMIVFSVSGKLCAAIATLPSPVIGALYCTLFGMIAAVGIQQTARADLTSGRNQMIIGFLLFMGLSLPVYFQQSPVFFAEPWTWLSEVVNIIFGTGMAVAVIFGMILDNTIPGTLEERGLK